MSTTITTPAPALTTGQQSAINLLAKVTPYLSETEQAIVTTAMAFSMPAESNPLMATFTALQGITNAFANSPNTTVATDAQIAGIFSSLIGSVVQGVETATTPATIVANAKPNFFLKLFHPHIAKQEETLAKTQVTASTPAMATPIAATVTK